MSKNQLVIIGDSRIDCLSTFTDHFTLHQINTTHATNQSSATTTLSSTTTPPPSTPSFEFTLQTKYYHAPIEIHRLTEFDIIEYITNPTTTSSRHISTILNNANCVIVVFDITHPHGFQLIQKLYTSSIHSLCLQVDTHIFAGCYSTTSSPSPSIRDDNDNNNNNNNTNTFMALTTTTIPQATYENWTKWQSFALDFNMQLILLNQLQYPTISYTTNHSQFLMPIKHHNQDDDDDDDDNNNNKKKKKKNINNNADDDANSDDEMAPNDLVELDSSEVGSLALISAISCCSWPNMTRITPPKLQPKNSTTSNVSINQSLPNSSPTPTEFTISPSHPSSNVTLGIPLLPTGHVYQFADSVNCDYIALNDDDIDSNLDALNALCGESNNDCDGNNSYNTTDVQHLNSTSPSPPTSTTTPSTTNQSNNNPSNVTLTNMDKKSGHEKQNNSKKKKGSSTSKSVAKSNPLTTLNSIDKIILQASQFQNTLKSGQVSDEYRRDHATLLTLRLAKEFSMFDDDCDMNLDDSMFIDGFNSFFSDDGFGLNAFGPTSKDQHPQQQYQQQQPQQQQWDQLSSNPKSFEDFSLDDLGDVDNTSHTQPSSGNKDDDTPIS